MKIYPKLFRKEDNEEASGRDKQKAKVVVGSIAVPKGEHKIMKGDN